MLQQRHGINHVMIVRKTRTLLLFSRVDWKLMISLKSYSPQPHSLSLSSFVYIITSCVFISFTVKCILNCLCICLHSSALYLIIINIYIALDPNWAIWTCWSMSQAISEFSCTIFFIIMEWKIWSQEII